MSIFKKVGQFLAGSNPVETIAGVVDRFTESKDEKRELFKEIYKLDAEERANARALYGKDSTVQKIFAMVFLIAYVTLTGFMLYWAFNHSNMELSDFQITTISTTFGAMSAKINTIVDFFFGASDKDRNANK